MKLSKIYKLKQNKNLLRSQSDSPLIRISQKNRVGSDLFKLSIFRRRLLQVWLWRRMRKSFKAWRSIRYVTTSLKNRPRFYRTNFRLNINLKKYTGWRLQQSSSVKFVNLKTKNRSQNLLFNCGQFFNTNVGTISIFYGMSRNQTRAIQSLKHGKFIINGKRTNSLLTENSIIYNRGDLHLRNKLPVETSQLLNALLQNVNIDKPVYYKYNPKLQRHLNSHYLLK